MDTISSDVGQMPSSAAREATSTANNQETNEGLQQAGSNQEDSVA